MLHDQEITNHRRDNQISIVSCFHGEGARSTCHVASPSVRCHGLQNTQRCISRYQLFCASETNDKADPPSSACVWQCNLLPGTGHVMEFTVANSYRFHGLSSKRVLLFRCDTRLLSDKRGISQGKKHPRLAPLRAILFSCARQMKTVHSWQWRTEGGGGCSNPPPRNSEDIGGVLDRVSKKNRRLDFLLQFTVFLYGCNLLNKGFF